MPAVEIRVDQVGVRTLKIGKDPRSLPPDEKRGDYVVPDGYRGIQQTTVPPGTYYINPYAEVIVPVEVRSHKAELTDIEFPSRDGFLLQAAGGGRICGAGGQGAGNAGPPDRRGHAASGRRDRRDRRPKTKCCKK